MKRVDLVPLTVTFLLVILAGKFTHRAAVQVHRAAGYSTPFRPTGRYNLFMASQKWELIDYRSFTQNVKRGNSYPVRVTTPEKPSFLVKL